MKIGFTGASGQGKTTTAKELLNCPEFVHFDFVKSKIRDAMDAGYNLNEDADRLSQLLILSDKVAADMSHNGHSFVTDRTPIDFYAHLNVRAAGYDEFYYNVYQNLTYSSMQTYSHVFYFPLALPVENNKYRSSDIHFHRMVDREIKGLLRDFGVKFTAMPPGTVKQRAEFIRFKLMGARYK